jgi:hypothetical protein
MGSGILPLANVFSYVVSAQELNLSVSCQNSLDEVALVFVSKIGGVFSLSVELSSFEDPLIGVSVRESVSSFSFPLTCDEVSVVDISVSVSDL